MALTSVPDKLRKLDVVRFAQRGSQLEKFKPAIAYWCYYRVVEKILTAGLQSDKDCKAYTAALMDKLEALTAEHSSDDSIRDDVAAAAYVEQFGTEAFQRADNAIRANKVTRQTADTFQASATFLELLHKWGAPSAEVESMIKYAKYHAVRILKAIKEGKDPNESNPQPEETAAEANEHEGPALDPNDPEVQRINAAASQQPSVEEEPEARELDPSPELAAQATPDPGYFPTEVTPDDLAVDMSDDAQPKTSSIPGTGGDISPPQTTTTPDAFQAYPPAHQPSVPVSAASRVTAASPPSVAPTARIATFNARTSPPTAPADAGALVTDDVAIANAQKHAKWAISALNFEDVPTAISELRNALTLLGAT